MSPAIAMSTSRRAKSLLVFFAFFIDQVACKGGKGGGIKGKGSDIGESVGSSLNLPPELTAVFAITIMVAVFTFYQIGRAASRLKKSVLPEGSPTLPYDVGKLFPWMLFAYLGVYLLWTILYAVLVTVAEPFLEGSARLPAERQLPGVAKPGKPS